MSTPIYQLSGRPMQMGLLLKLPYLELERYTSRRLAELTTRNLEALCGWAPSS